jgi:hypothetical protein
MTEKECLHDFKYMMPDLENGAIGVWQKCDNCGKEKTVNQNELLNDIIKDERMKGIFGYDEIMKRRRAEENCLLMSDDDEFL